MVLQKMSLSSSTGRRSFPLGALRELVVWGLHVYCQPCCQRRGIEGKQEGAICIGISNLLIPHWRDSTSAQLRRNAQANHLAGRPMRMNQKFAFLRDEMVIGN